MEQSMTGNEMEIKFVFMGIKFVSVCIFVWFIQPIIGLIAMPIDTIGMLTPHMRANLDDAKLILAVVVPSLLGIKYLIDIYKSRKGITKK